MRQFLPLAASFSTLTIRHTPDALRAAYILVRRFNHSLIYFRLTKRPKRLSPASKTFLLNARLRSICFTGKLEHCRRSTVHSEFYVKLPKAADNPELAEWSII